MKPLAQNTLIQNRYLIVHRIGKGGMGEVYLAVDQRLGSAVALKRTFFAGDQMLGNAFEREARTLARMRHPVLPKVSDHFSENDEQYLIMEHISGDDLSKRLDAAGKPFPLSWVLFWADQLLDALSYLHTHEPPIIHRDIKPQNLKLTDENHIILLDFGLSKITTGQTNISQSGSTGSVVGYTPHYAPMEQIRGIGTSPRSDLYSLSATLYQLLTNTIPVDALSRADAMLNDMPDPINPPMELNPEVPKAVSDVILRGMEVSQEKRYANAREMQRVLRKTFNEIQQATTANTVAFTAEETRAIVGTPPPVEGMTDAFASSDTKEHSSGSVTDAPAIMPDSAVDLDATMAYEKPGVPSAPRQADVRTEVFLAGGESFALPDEPVNDGYTSDSEVSGSVAEFSEPDGSGSEELKQDEARSFEPQATVPFIAVPDAQSEITAHSNDEDLESIDPAPVWPNSGSEPASSGPDEVPFFEPGSSEPKAEYEAAALAPAAPMAVQERKSSGKIFLILGALAAVLLLGGALIGGVWYMTYGPGRAVVAPTPEPTPDDSLVSTPSPEPTIEALTNTDVDSSNQNTNVSSNSNDNSDLMVDPTPIPDRTPLTGSTPSTTKPTPRPQPTVRPPSTPTTRPTPRQTPVTRPTVMP
ncbi:MAG TPA: serine/threonine-protein kinase [Pyrinomonadaceae bacterium]|nr:serine/threonine-protein kinase [Pyrinomonadaceae bacterium]